MEKFVETSKTERGHDKIDSWYNYCRKKQVPYITIQTRTRFADVHWDYYSYDNTVDHTLCTNEDTMKEELQKIISNYANEKTCYSANCNLIYIDNLYIDEARIVAGEIYDLLSKIVSGNVPIP